MKGLDFLKGFSELAEDIVLEAKKPEQYRKQKKPKGNIIKFVGVAAAVVLLVGMAAAAKLGLFRRSAGISTGNGNRRYYSNVEEPKLQVMDNLGRYTDLEVITERPGFTSVTQDQHYNPETDQHFKGMSMVADAGETVYIATKEGELFTFQKETNTAEIACHKSGCEHKIEAGGDCEANLRVGDADIGGLQYYKGDLYYSLWTNNSAILYKMSTDTKSKQFYVSLFGETEYGTRNWMIHRGYLYFIAKHDGFYRIPINNPKQKEKLLSLTNIDIQDIEAEGSYIYFILQTEKSQAVARYNIESGKIEQFTDIGEEYEIREFMVNNEMIYYNGTSEFSGSIFSYNTNTGTKETFLKAQTGKQITKYTASSVDLNYIYVIEDVYDDVFHMGRISSSRTSVYTFDGEFVGVLAIRKETSSTKVLEPFNVFHYEYSEYLGEDENKEYYMEEVYDTQCNEKCQEKYMEGTGKRTLSYINKSEFSPDIETPQKYAACEMEYKEK